MHQRDWREFNADLLGGGQYLEKHFLYSACVHTQGSLHATHEGGPGMGKLFPNSVRQKCDKENQDHLF